MLNKKRNAEKKLDELFTLVSQENSFSQENTNNESIKIKTICLKVGDDMKTYDTIQTKRLAVQNLFDEFKKENDPQIKFDKMKLIIDIIETNHEFNFEFLKLNKKLGDYTTTDKLTNNKITWTYEDNFDSLCLTLTPTEYKYLA